LSRINTRLHSRIYTSRETKILATVTRALGNNLILFVANCGLGVL
jgi:hypothetical protein